MNKIVVEEYDPVDEAALETIKALRKEGISAFSSIKAEMTRPSVLYRPALTFRDRSWRAEYGAFVGFGGTPALAMANFDRTFAEKQKP